MNRAIAPVTKNLLLINVIVFLFTWPLLGDSSMFEGLTGLSRSVLAAYFPAPGSGLFEPYQVVTSMFMHGGFAHLLFNMYALWMFGSIIEGALGPKRYLLYYLICGFGALLLHWLATYVMAQGATELFTFPGGGTLPGEYGVPVLGASGAIYGLLIAFAYIAPNAVLQLIIPPIPLKAKYFVLILIGFDLFAGFSRYNTGVAHFAHLGGAAVGFLLLTLWSRQGGLYQR